MAGRKNVLIVGKSEKVLADTVALLAELDYEASATNRFDDVLVEFDTAKFDLVVFGGRVPPDTREYLKVEIAAGNPDVIFVHGLAGIPGLITEQVEGAFAAHHRRPEPAPVFDADLRALTITLDQSADVAVTLWWPTSFVPPDPKSDSRLLLDSQLAAGTYNVPVPEDILVDAAFATVQVDRAIYPMRLVEG